MRGRDVFEAESWKTLSKASLSHHKINNSKKTLEAFDENRENQQNRPNCLRKINFSDELLFTLNLTPEQEPCACATFSFQGLENRFWKHTSFHWKTSFSHHKSDDSSNATFVKENCSLGSPGGPLPLWSTQNLGASKSPLGAPSPLEPSRALRKFPRASKITQPWD